MKKLRHIWLLFLFTAAMGVTASLGAGLANAGKSTTQADHRPAAQSSALRLASNHDWIMGLWTLEWKGRRTYSGTLLVDRSLGNGRFHGFINVRWSGGNFVGQEADIRVKGGDVKIRGYDPTRKRWNADTFYVKWKDGRLVGYSVDAVGQRGKRIVFSR